MPRLAIDYSNTIIYKIVCKDLNIKDLYVGHTTDFKRRKTEHKKITSQSSGKSYKLKLYEMIRTNGGWDNWDMIEIEKYNCADGNEARSKERYWLEFLNAALNCSMSSRTKKNGQKITKKKLNSRENKIILKILILLKKSIKHIMKQTKMK